MPKRRLTVERLRANYQIRVKEVRVIDETGKQIGIKPLFEAIKVAQDKSLDLVEIVPNSFPPVCKIMDYTKFKYNQKLKFKQERKKQKVIQQIKEIRIRPVIEEHDLEFKINHICEFLEQKHKVKITIMFFGREIVHQESGYKLLNKIKEKIINLGEIEGTPKLEGNRLVVYAVPLKK